jgi:hypothetical protein
MILKFLATQPTRFSKCASPNVRSTAVRLLRWFCCLLVVWVVLTVPLSAKERPQSAEPTLSLEARNEPLGKLLDRISQETAYVFQLDPSWATYPVTISFRNLPLGQGLKRILANLNHAVVYEGPREVRIIIFGKVVLQPAGSSASSQPMPVSPSMNEESTEEGGDEDIGNKEGEEAPEKAPVEGKQPETRENDEGVKAPPAN